MTPGNEFLSPALESRFRLHTNISRFDIPLHLFDGNLRFTLYSIDQREFDFGTLAAGQERFIMFAITNENPIPITLKNAAMPTDTILELLGVEEGNHSVLSYDHSQSDYQWKPGENFTVPARSFAVFRFTLIAPKQNAVFHSRIILKSSFQVAEFPVTFTVEEGSITSVPEKIIIDEAFPGKISSHALQVFSAFPRDMPLLRLSTLSNDPRFFFESMDKEQSPMIKQGEISRLGRIFFMPLATCLDDCYVGLPLDTEDGQHWIRGMRLPADLPEIDVYLYRKLRSKWETLVERGENIANSTIMVDSTEIKNFPIEAEGRLVWPRLMKQNSVQFPLTAVGNYTIVNVTLQNPSNLPVAVQMLPLTIYPGPYDLIKMLGSDIASPLTEYVEVDDVLIFSLRDSELYNARLESPVPHLRQELESIVGIQIPRFTLSMLLQPGMKVRVRIGFLPPDYQLRSTLLLIRNNLTVLETVTLYGRGGKLELRIGNKLPNSKQMLLFEIPQKYLKECENVKRLQHKFSSSLTVRHSFVARNTGELPLHISNISINNHPCSGRGFRILNCEAFRLQPNETHVLDVAFTADFTMSWYEAHLQLYIAGTVAPLNYAIGVSLPREWLAKCQAAMPRPYWEPLMYYSCVTALGFLLICVIASAYLEGDRIITCALRQQALEHQRRTLELNGQLKPFSLKNPPSLSDASLTADAAAIASDHADVFESSEQLQPESPGHTPTGEKPRSLAYRLLILFYNLIKNRTVRNVRSDQPTPATPNGDTQHEKSQHGRLGNTTRPASELKSRRSSGGPTTNHAEITRKLSDESSGGGGNSKKANVAIILDRKQQTGGKSARKKHHGPIHPKENSVVKEDVKPPKFEPISEPAYKRNPNHQAQPSPSPAPVPMPQPTHSTIPKNPNLTRRVPLSDKEIQNRKPEMELPKRKFENGGIRNRRSREVSESEPDDHRSFASLRIHRPSPTPVPTRPSPRMAPMSPKFWAEQPKIEIQKVESKNRSELSQPSPPIAPIGNFARQDQLLKVAISPQNGGHSESEESAVPEWDRASLASAGEQLNIDEAFDRLASDTHSFAISSSDKLAINDATPKSNRLSIATNSARLNTANLPSPLGNESILSSTSRSNSISSLDASESSSPSPDELRHKMKKVATSDPTIAGHKRKKPPTTAGGLPRQTHSLSAAIGEGRKNVAISQQQPQLQPQQHRHQMQQPQLAAASSAAGKSIMQQLREERIRRLQDHIKKIQSGEDWPGFDTQLPNLSESLWDEDHDPWRGNAVPRPPGLALNAEEKPQTDIWGSSTWTPLPSNISTDRPSSTENPFPSFFDLPVTTSRSPWPPNFTTAPERFGSNTASPLNILEEELADSTPPPEDSSIVAWGPPLSPGGTDASAEAVGFYVQPDGAQAARWASGSVMTGVDIPWTQTLLKEEPRESDQK